MKRSRYTEEQIIYALRQAESGIAVSYVCRHGGVGSDVLRLDEEVRPSGAKRAA